MDSTTTITPKSQRHHLRDVVESYLKNRMPRDLHPSYEAIDNDVAAQSRPILPPYSRTEPLLKISEQHGDTVAEPEDEEEISL